MTVGDAFRSDSESTTAGAPSAPLSASTSVLLTIAVALGLALRLVHLGQHSLWIDEISSLQLSAGRGVAEIDPPLDVLHPIGVDTTGLEEARPWPQVFSAVSRDTHPPLYFLVLRFWRVIFGPGDVAARSLSVLCSLGCILAIFNAATLLHGRWAGLWAAAIMGAATPQIVFAQEARGYAMLSLLLLCAIVALARIQVLGPAIPRSLALAISLLAALLTHYTAIPALLALAVYALVGLKGGARRSAISAILLALAVFLLSWGPVLWQQRGNFASNLAWTADDKPGLALRTMGRLASLPIQFFLAPPAGETNGWIARLGAVMYLAPLLAIRRRKMWIWVLLGGAIIATTALSDLLQHRKGLETLRFTIPAAPAAYALLAAGAAALPQRWMAHSLSGIVFLGCLSCVPEAYNQFWKADVSGLTRTLDADAGPGDVLIIPYVSRQQDWGNALLLGAVTHYSQHPHRPMLALSEPISETARDSANKAPRVWMLCNGLNVPIGQFLPGARIVRVHMISSAACAQIQFTDSSNPTVPQTRSPPPATTTPP